MSVVPSGANEFRILLVAMHTLAPASRNLRIGVNVRRTLNSSLWNPPIFI